MDGKRSIQDIIPPARSRPIREQPTHMEDEAGASPRLPLKSKRSHDAKSFLGMFGIACAVIVVIGVAFGVVSTVFHRATLTITPHAFHVTVAEVYPVGTEEGSLSFQTVSHEETRSKTVASTKTEQAEDYAQGTITIVNEYSTQAQRLITNTRFETESGLIYRIKSSVTVPGYTTAQGKKVPGTIDVTVYADEPGETYNIGPASFTIPGLAGSPQYQSMYARSSSAFSGGFVGNRAVVEKSLRNEAIIELKSELERSLRAGLLGKIPSSDVLLQDMVKVEFIEAPDRAVDGGAEISIKAIASAPVITEQNLAARIAESGGVVFTAPLTIANRDAITLQAQSEDEVVTGFAVSGDVALVASIDTDALLSEIAGKDQKNIGPVLLRYPGVKDLNLSVYPFWRQTLPENPTRFTVDFDE